MERFGEATGAYAKATELNPNDADLWAEYAFATAMAGDRKIDGKAIKLVEHALKVDPDNTKAVQLAGTAAFEQRITEGHRTVAARLKQGACGLDLAQAISARIDEAKRLSK